MIYCLKQLVVRGTDGRLTATPDAGGPSPAGCADPRPDTAQTVTVVVSLFAPTRPGCLFTDRLVLNTRKDTFVS